MALEKKDGNNDSSRQRINAREYKQMSYKKNYNSHSNWEKYCSKNEFLIKELDTNIWVFQKEANFRDFATDGKISDSNEIVFNFKLLKNKQFWNLHSFITAYFDYDSILFTRFEKERIHRSESG